MQCGRIVQFILSILLWIPLYPCDGQARQFTDRMAGWQYTLVATDEKVPNSCLSTYISESYSCTDTHLLAKMVVGLGTGSQIIWTATPEVVSVEDFPGGVEAIYRLDGHLISTRILPVIADWKFDGRQGGALYEVRCIPPAPLFVKCGESRVIHKGVRSPQLRIPLVGNDGDMATIKDGAGLLTNAVHTLKIVVKASGDLVKRPGDRGGSILEASFPQGQGTLMLGYSEMIERALDFASINPSEAARKVEDHYHQLLQARIETPEKELNDAFKGAITTLEYSWIWPYGWTESIHHNLGMLHMQATGGLTWIGQDERVKKSILTHAQFLSAEGAVPQFSPGQGIRSDFGGSDQFYAWQLAQYWNYTGDLEFARHIVPVLDRIIQHTFQENDPDENGLLGWGLQVGNQENFVATPNDGTTPTIEGLQMLRLRADLARALGDPATEEHLQRRIAIISQKLRSQLWQTDLGRFLFYRDPLGIERFDGQYHTLIYPLIWNVVDPLDAWTSLRHLRDRLTGEKGEIYCSNNFPHHLNESWGMQAGAAQQPWGAWGLSALGLRNETCHPLKAVAGWVMNEDHRGSWMEISEEPTASYFTPPAGLYIQSTIEALYGLRMRGPEGALQISPSFPDAWSTASVYLPDVSAVYSREGNHLRYVVHTSQSLKRTIRWLLPPSAIHSVRVDGQTVEYTTSPGVDCISLNFETPSLQKSDIEVSFQPTPVTVDHPGSIAEREELLVKLSGARILEIEDRSRILAGLTEFSPSQIKGTIAEGLLSPYCGFGPLGQMNFSRRSLFLRCMTDEGAIFWKPVDLTILPRYETAAVSEAQLLEDGAQFPLIIRNNTSHPLEGQAILTFEKQELKLGLSIAARSETTHTIHINKQFLGLFCPGDNAASLLLPDGTMLKLNIKASQLFRPGSELRSFLDACVVKLSLPQDQLIPDTEWTGMRNYYTFSLGPWNASRPPLEGLGLGLDKSVEVRGLNAIPFDIVNRKMIPVSGKLGKPFFQLNLNEKVYSKIFLLVVPFLDNHDTFSRVGRVSLVIAKSTDYADQRGTGVITRDLSFPGDLDSWCPMEVVGALSTTGQSGSHTSRLLPLLAAHETDWIIARPPQFPQADFWSSSLSLKTASSVMNVIEVDLDGPKPLRSLTLSSLGTDPAYGVVAVTALLPPDQNLAERFASLLPSNPPVFPRYLFRLNSVGILEGWRTEGDAFGVSTAFGHVTLNSYGRATETTTGKAISPPFVLSEDFLDFQLHGGNSLAETGDGALSMSLVDHTDGSVLTRVHPGGSHLLTDYRIPVSDWKGREVHLELEDSNTNEHYAWIGIWGVRLSTK